MQDPMWRTPLQLLSGSHVEINPKHWMPFGAPVYVLNQAPRDGKLHHKWEKKLEVGIYLQRSPLHLKEVALVLNRTLGYVSPQFHIKVDKGFYLLQQERLSSTWQVATGFRSSDPPGGRKGKQPPLQQREKAGKVRTSNQDLVQQQGEQLLQPQSNKEGAPIEPEGASPARNESTTQTGMATSISQDGMGLGTPAIRSESHEGLQRSTQV